LVPWNPLMKIILFLISSASSGLAWAFLDCTWHHHVSWTSRWTWESCSL
jgi:hypothetical protein